MGAELRKDVDSEKESRDNKEDLEDDLENEVNVYGDDVCLNVPVT